MDFTLDLKSVLMFSQLQVLGQMKLLVDDHVFQNLVFGCLKIEELYLKRCKKLENLRRGPIHPRLNVVHVYRCYC